MHFFSTILALALALNMSLATIATPVLPGNSVVVSRPRDPKTIPPPGNGVLSNPTADPKFKACRNILCKKFSPGGKLTNDPWILRSYGIAPGTVITDRNYVGINTTIEVPANETHSVQTTGMVQVRMMVNCSNIFTLAINAAEKKTIGSINIALAS